MSWLLIAVTVWMAVAAPMALLLGRCIRRADELEALPPAPFVPDHVPANWTVTSAGQS